MMAEAEKLPTPDNCVIAYIDHQPKMTFGLLSHDRQTIKNFTVGLGQGRNKPALQGQG